MSTAPVEIETNDIKDLEAHLLSLVNGARSNVAEPTRQAFFRRVRSSDCRGFILNPIWWQLLNAGVAFSSWANKVQS